MKLNPNSWYVWLYRSTYELYACDLPTNLCPFFWKLLLAFVLLPITWIGHLCNARDINAPALGVGSIVYFVSLSGLCLVPKGHVIQSFHEYLKYYGYGLIITGCLAILIVLIVFIGDLIERRKERRSHKIHIYKPRVFKEKRPWIITTFIKAKYKRYCPKINWTSTKS